MKGKRCQDSGHLAIILSSWRPRQEHRKSMARLRYTRKPCFRKIWSSTGRSKVRGRKGRVHNFSGCRYLEKVFHLDWCWCPPIFEKLGEYVMCGVAAALLWLWGEESLGKSECVNNARVETSLTQQSQSGLCPASLIQIWAITPVSPCAAVQTGPLKEGLDSLHSPYLAFW